MSRTGSYIIETFRRKKMMTYQLAVKIQLMLALCILFELNKQSTTSKDISVVDLMDQTDSNKDDQSQRLERTNCPSECRCTEETSTTLLHVDCSNKHLYSIPTIPTNTITLTLKGNRLEVILENEFRNLNHMISLDLSRNKIKKLEQNCFLGLSNLDSLSLNSNDLKYKDSIPRELFKPLIRLKMLSVDDNCKTDEDCRSLVREVTTISSLKELSTDGYQGLEFDPSFRNLKKLNRLSFGGYHGRCDMDGMSEKTFQAFSNTPLLSISLSNCNIQQVSPGVLSPVKSLKAVDLTANRELCHGGWRNITTGLHLTSIQTIDLDYNCNSQLNNHTISAFDLGPLYKTKLMTLYLSRCNLQFIAPEVVTDALPVSLKDLHLDDNDLNYPYFAIFLPVLRNLGFLDVSSQSNYKSTRRLSSVEHFLKKNVFEKKSNLGKYFESGCDLKLPVLDLPQKLRFLNASHLHLPYPIPNMSFNPNNSLEAADGSYCLFPSICGRIIGLLRLKHLNLSQNRIEYINREAFSDMPLLEELDLSGNRFGHIFDDDQSYLNFNNLPKLRILDMSSCKIKHLPRHVFSTLIVLQVLKLKDNALETVDFGLESMIKSLRLLDVSKNSIKYLPAITTNMLKRMKIATFKLALYGNELQCGCTDLSFVKWLAYTKIKLINRKSTACNIKNGTKIKIEYLKQKVDEIALDCFTWVVVTACVSYMLISVLVLSLCAVMYRQRWKLMYLYYTSVKRVNPYFALENNRENMNDVYISFDEDHVLADGTRLYQIVSIDILNALTARGFSAKIREDLYAGKSLQTLISSVIQESNKTVVFLSRDFCSDFWNTFEFNMAVCDGMFTHRKVVVPVLVENADIENFIPEIRTYLHEEKILKFSITKFDDFIEHLCHMISN